MARFVLLDAGGVTEVGVGWFAEVCDRGVGIGVWEGPAEVG